MKIIIHTLALALVVGTAGFAQAKAPSYRSDADAYSATSPEIAAPVSRYYGSPEGGYGPNDDGSTWTGGPSGGLPNGN